MVSLVPPVVGALWQKYGPRWRNQANDREARTAARRARSSSPSSAASLRRQKAKAGKKQEDKGVLGVKDAGIKKRKADPKPAGGKRPRKKGNAIHASDANSDVEASHEKISAAEQAAVNAEPVVEPVERVTRADPKYADWTDAEIILFNQLQDRGLVPLLSTSCKLDFTTLPKELFTADDTATFINSRKGNNFQVARSLQELFKVGSRIRARLVDGRLASDTLSDTIRKYIRWAMQDAGLSKCDLIPILVVKRNQVRGDHQRVISRMRRGLAQLAKRHRERYNNAVADSTESKGKKPVQPKVSLNNSGLDNDGTVKMPDVPGAIPPPVLFGIILVNGVMTFVALDASMEDAKLQTIGIFDWANSGQDVWNGLAIAILVMMVRNYLESLNVASVEIESSEDPDA